MRSSSRRGESWVALIAHALLFVGIQALPKADPGPLKVFVLAGQSNMEGQAEVNKTCTAVEPGKCSAVGAVMNGTLVYQLSDPRTEALFAQCWDKQANNWTMLKDVKIWFNEKGKVAPPTEACPLGCPTRLADGTYGDMSIGFGVGGHTSLGSRPHIGPEYGFGFALNSALHEPVLVIKTAWGGKTLCGDFRPPSSVNATSKPVGFYYKQMLQYVKDILNPANMTSLFPDLAAPLKQGAKIVGFGWDQGWNDGCGVECTDEYETNMVNLIADLRKEWNNPDMAVSIPVSGFDGWDQKNARRLGIINAQFGACNATRHPGQHNCVSEETRSFWRQFANSPVRYHHSPTASTMCARNLPLRVCRSIKAIIGGTMQSLTF